MGRTQPYCAKMICKQGDIELCTECEAIKAAIARRLPTIIKVFIFFLTIQLLYFVVFSSQRLVDYWDDSKGILNIDPPVTVCQLLFELIYCISFFIAIYHG